jgi:hypothetical protein
MILYSLLAAQFSHDCHVCSISTSIRPHGVCSRQRHLLSFREIVSPVRNVPFLMVMVGNLAAVMGLYIPYVFLPAVSIIQN